MVRRPAPRRKPSKAKSRAGRKHAAPEKVSPHLARAQRLLQQKKFKAAYEAAQAAVQENPADWQALEFAAPFLLEIEPREMGLRALEDAMNHAPDTAAIQLRLATKMLVVTRQLRLDLDRAIARARDAIAQHGPNPGILMNLIGALVATGRHAEAVAAGVSGIKQFPKTRPLYFNTSLPLLELGQLEESVKMFANFLTPFRPGRGKSKAALRQQYRDLAAGYDDKSLHRSFSFRMADFISRVLGATENLRVLDAGCGTGLLAANLNAARFVGLDLSEDMLARARARKLYDELAKGDLVRLMAKRKDSFDLVVSACVLYHIADLAPYFKQAARRLAPGGHLFFSVDSAPDSMTIGIGNPGEYAHSRRYLRRLAAAAGFDEVAIEIMNHRSCPGFWCAFRKRGDGGRNAAAATSNSPAVRPSGRRKARSPSPDDLLAAAFEMSQSQGIAQALRAIEEILNKHPNHWATIKYRYFLLWSVGHFEVALAAADEALKRAADSIEILEDLAAYFLEVAIRKAKENEAFVPHINPAIALVSHLAGHPKMNGRFQMALQYSLAAMRRHAEALDVGQKGLALYPKYEQTFHYNNSFDLFELGRHEEAIVSFGRRLKPFTGETDRAKPADRYMELAADYDDNRLHQSYPKLMAQMIIKTVGATVAKRILDAGCGTGSLGTQIRAARLVGIDRSPEMLAKARARNVYHELIEADLVAEMARRTDPFDIIVSTVVLYHIGDLAPYFREAARLLGSGGYLFFSTDPAPDTIEIGVTGPGEYAHSRAYVRRLAADHGFAEVSVKLLPHRGNPGFWWALRRT